MPPEEAPPIGRPGIGAAIAAAEAKARKSLLRNHGGGHAAVSNLELFFDLIFVFAVTQLSHFQLAHLSLLGAFKTLILFGAVWWAWMYTTWATNWIDPDRAANRLVLGAVMLASMVMSAAIPDAFGAGGLAFAVAYVVIQIFRSAYCAWAMERENVGGGLNMRRVTVWFSASAVLWLGGALIDDVNQRIGLWLLALVIEYSGPFAFFRVPGMGRSDLSDWIISGSHMSERCGLFIIIALGEGLIITGATYAGASAQPGLDLALLNAFLGSFAMWWLYFDMGARRGLRHIENHRAPGLIARQAFTYWHIPIVAGIILLAVGDELVLAHPLEPVHGDFVAVVTGGTLLFIAGLAGFKRISSGNPWFPASHVYGLVLTLGIGAWGLLLHPPSLLLFAVVTVLFAAIAVWEWVSFHGGWIERLEARDMWLGHVMRRRFNRLRAARLAREEAAQKK